MKIAITAKGNSKYDKLDNRFGRCNYFVIYDIVSGSMEFIPNQHKDNIDGAGSAAVKFIASRGVKKVISGEFGAKVKSTFDQLQIQLIILHDPEIKIFEIISLLNKKIDPA
jgi:predicted Fe-Mo cluster-binding NifX family protein